MGNAIVFHKRIRAGKPHGPLTSRVILDRNEAAKLALGPAPLERAMGRKKGERRLQIGGQ